MKALFLGIAACCVLLAGCAGINPVSPQQRLARFEAAAGPPTPVFRFYQTLYSWEPLSQTEVVVYTRPSKAYLLDLAPCPGLMSAYAIGITSHLDRVRAGLDEIITGRAYSPMPCQISRIRPLDLKALHAARKQAQKKRQIDAVPRSSGSAPAAAGSS